jgi:hypothetical protein
LGHSALPHIAIERRGGAKSRASEIRGGQAHLDAVSIEIQSGQPVSNVAQVVRLLETLLGRSL